MGDKTYIPPEILRLMELGRNKKLWCLEIVYNLNHLNGTHETKREPKRNLDDEQLMKIREKMFRYGFDVPVETGHWIIVCPMDILSVHLFRQDNYIPDTNGQGC